jgi:methyltransferase (TIGR00027 family)
MRPGRESQTAVMVCMGRALAHGRTSVAKFADPTALALLPGDTRQRVERLRAGAPPKGLRGRLECLFLNRRSKMMVARTVAIDEAVRAAAAPQLVILGAGLDGRAWRMPELREVTVFEVDHPDSQRVKRSRVSALAAAAQHVHFVPVDFSRDRLEDALAAAGHDRTRPTTWIWEGVVMYLSLRDIEATLGVIERCSSAGSHLIVAYHSPAPILRFVGLLVLLLGEPLRSALTASEMRALLARFGFDVTQDEDLPGIAGKLSSDVAQATRSMKHLRIATAVRTDAPNASWRH